MTIRPRLRLPLSVLAALGLALACAPSATADLRIVSTEGSSMEGDASSMPEAMRKAFGQNAPKRVTLWIGDDRSARVDEDVSMIVRLDRNETYSLNHRERRYRVTPIGGNRGSGPRRATWSIKKSAERRQVGRWVAVRHDLAIDMGGTPMEVRLWVSDVGVNPNAIRPFIEAFAVVQGLDWMRAYLELDGYPVRQEVRIGPIVSWQEVTSVDQGAAPAGTYDVPDGYTKRD